MGILDSKSRIMDVVITEQGRRQIASGKMRAEFISFTDGSTFYEFDVNEGQTDAADRIYFEVMERPEDMITFETDDSGKLFGPTFSPNVAVQDGQILQIYTGSNLTNRSQVATGSNFASLSATLLSSSLTNFKNNYLINTRRADDISNQFQLDTNSIEFKITNFRPFMGGPDNEKINLDAIEPFFLDKRLSHLDNFKFLPPVTKNGDAFGSYSDISERKVTTFDELIQEVGWEKDNEVIYDRPRNPYTFLGYNDVDDPLLQNETGLKFLSKERQKIKFQNSSAENNVIIQFFETAEDNLRKLDMIDFGEFSYSEDSLRPNKRVFFVGKVYEDNYGAHTFVNLFTVVMD